MRRTISNLSRELGASRPRIYRALDRLGIEKRSSGEYSLEEWEQLKNELIGVSKINKQKKVDAEKVRLAGAAAASLDAKCHTTIHDIEIATIKERLNHAKQEYDYNKSLILKFQKETDEYFQANNSTTIETHNGTMASIPSIVSLDKYVKLNISLSKLISDLEGDLDLEADGEDDDLFG